MPTSCGLQSEWADSVDTVEGRRVHARVDRPGTSLPPSLETAAEVERALVVRAVTISSETLRVIAKIDIAEAEDGFVTPIDYKRGKRPHVAAGAYKPERIQICLQTLPLEEHGYRVREGGI